MPTVQLFSEHQSLDVYLLGKNDTRIDRHTRKILVLQCHAIKIV